MKENDGTEHSGLAMALYNANNGYPTSWGPTNKVGNSSYRNLDPTAWDSGYKITWDPTFSYDNTTVKGISTEFPAFYYAGQYNPSTTGSNITQWFLPAGGDIDAVMRNLYWGAGTPGAYGMGTHVNGYGYPLANAIGQVGGVSILTSMSYWIATEGANRHIWNTGACDESHFRHFRTNGIYFSYTTKNQALLVRPFVHF